MIKVLIVDDEPLARENLRILLQGQDDIEIRRVRERGRSDWRGT